MESNPEEVLKVVTAALVAALGDNLRACCVYGSYARGNPVPGVSDLNLFVVLERSDAAAHAALARVFSTDRRVDPFIVERATLQRTARCFASKFASIQHNYRVLHGADPFSGLQKDPSLERLLCEQALRNIRLRLTYAFVMNNGQRKYREFLAASVSPIFIQLSDVLRLSGQAFEKDFAARIPLMERAWGVDPGVLRDLLALRAAHDSLAESAIGDWHERVLVLLDTVLRWVEAHWTEPRVNP
jgi:predicted nucleotidyltransferase